VGGGLESVTESKYEIVTESVESVTESKAEPIEDIRRIVERWGEKLVPHQDASGQITQPRWAKCWEMWQEIANAVLWLCSEGAGFVTGHALMLDGGYTAA
jgi:NAD(P)-dependent dehydrogenase (short-subunit alcohol dehydrogenase family)